MQIRDAADALKQLRTASETLFVSTLAVVIASASFLFVPSLEAHTLIYLALSAAAYVVPFAIWLLVNFAPEVRNFANDGVLPVPGERRSERPSPLFMATMILLGMSLIPMTWSILVDRAQDREIVRGLRSQLAEMNDKLGTIPVQGVLGSRETPNSSSSQSSASGSIAATPTPSPLPTSTPPPPRLAVAFETTGPLSSNAPNDVLVTLGRELRTDRTHWLLRRAPGFDDRLFAQGPPRRKAVEPLLTFTIFLPIQGRSYEFILVECTPQGEEFIRSIVDTRDTELPLPEFPQGCLDIGSTTLVASEVK